MDEDIIAHEDRIKDLNAQCDEFLDSDTPVGGDKDEMRERRDSINTRFANVKVSVCSSHLSFSSFFVLLEN